MNVIVNKIIPTLLSSFATLVLLLSGGLAHASNGLQVISTGPISLGLGGAGVAKPQSSNALYINPAGMVGLDYQADLSFTTAFPSNLMGSSLAPAGNPTAITAAGVDDAAFIPAGSMVFKAFGSDRLSLGVGAIPSAGFQVEFPVSRFNNAITGNNYDRSGRYGNIKILPGFSFKINDKIKVGGAVDINYAFFHSDSATLQLGFPETGGDSRFDSALGIGGRIGVIYTPIDMLSIGLMYVTRSYMQQFTRYADLLPTGLDLPQQVHVGVAVTPMEGALILADFRYLDWSSGFIGTSLGQGGLQWRDQYTLAAGFQYNFLPKLNFPLTLRLGYNYGNSPITPSNTFRNLLIPTVIEHHLTTGLSLDLTEHIGFDLAYIHEFQNTVTDDGSGNPTGAGSFVGTSVNAFSVGIRGHWGHKAKPN